MISQRKLTHMIKRFFNYILGFFSIYTEWKTIIPYDNGVSSLGYTVYRKNRLTGLPVIFDENLSKKDALATVNALNNYPVISKIESQEVINFCIKKSYYEHSASILAMKSPYLYLRYIKGFEKKLLNLMAIKKETLKEIFGQQSYTVSYAKERQWIWALSYKGVYFTVHSSKAGTLLRVCRTGSEKGIATICLDFVDEMIRLQEEQEARESSKRVEDILKQLAESQGPGDSFFVIGMTNEPNVEVEIDTIEGKEVEVYTFNPIKKENPEEGSLSLNQSNTGG